MVKSKVYSLTRHLVCEGDARNLSSIKTESVHLVCTSPPYGCLKTYPDHDGQLGNIASYERFLDELDRVWSECLRVLVPGGRIACVVGDGKNGENFPATSGRPQKPYVGGHTGGS